MKISVIIVTYNYGKFIKDALESILRQSFTDYEVIVVDDGSTDNTSAIVDSWIIPFNGRLRYFRKDNEGVAMARNYGISKARGEYVAFLDADDVWFKDTLKKLLSCIEKNPDCGLVYGNVEFYNRALRRAIGQRFPGMAAIAHEGKCFDKLFIYGNFIHTSTSLVRRCCFDEVGIFDRRFKCGEDLDMWIRMTSMFKVKYLDELLAKVREHQTSLSFSFHSANKSVVLMTRKLSSLIPDFRSIIGEEQVRSKLYTAYYTIGAHYILEGQNKRGRLWMRKAMKIDPWLFKNKILFYLALSFMPFSPYFKKLRKTNISLARRNQAERKIKILHIIKTLNLGGAETNLLNLARSFNERSFDVHVAYSSQGELEEAFRNNGIKLFKFSTKSARIKSFESLLIVWRLFRYIRQQKIDIVHTHTFNAHIWGGLAAKLAGCKIMEHVHDSRYIDPEEFDKRGERNTQYQFIKFLNNFSDRVIVLTKQNQDFILKNRLYQPEMVQEIQNGIDLKAVKSLSPIEKIALKQKLSLPLDARVVLTPIRFSPEKNLNVLFQIALDVCRRYEKAVFVIAGTGPEKEAFEAKVMSHSLENRIKTIGFYADIPELLAITDVFLLPSTIELHSIAIMEAMRQKVPVVVSRNVGCHDKFLRHWENGVLFNPFNSKGWGDAIIKLLEDDELRQRIGEAGFETLVQQFDIKDVARKFENIYENLLAF